MITKGVAIVKRITHAIEIGTAAVGLLKFVAPKALLTPVLWDSCSA